jgi:hypothetical protein
MPEIEPGTSVSVARISDHMTTEAAALFGTSANTDLHVYNLMPTIHLKAIDWNLNQGPDYPESLQRHLQHHSGCYGTPSNRPGQLSPTPQSVVTTS